MDAHHCAVDVVTMSSDRGGSRDADASSTGAALYSVKIAPSKSGSLCASDEILFIKLTTLREGRFLIPNFN